MSKQTEIEIEDTDSSEDGHGAPGSEPAPWEAAVTDLRSNLQAVTARLEAAETEREYWKGRAHASLPATPAEAVKKALQDIPDADFKRAIDEGDTDSLIKLIRDQATTIAQREVQNLRETELNPLVSQFGQGLDVLSAHTKELVKSGMRYAAIPEVQADMEKNLQQLTPQQRMHPDGVRYAYDLAVGRNPQKVVEFERKEAERAARGDDFDGGGKVTPSRMRRTTSLRNVPSAEDLGGGDAVRAAKAKGGEDALAIKLGYKGWDDYMEQCGMIENGGAA